MIFSRFKIKFKSDFDHLVVVCLQDNRFVGFGWNKVSHVMELEAAGLEFLVLPNVFVVHMPHAPSLDIAKFRTSKQYRRSLEKSSHIQFHLGIVQKWCRNAILNNFWSLLPIVTLYILIPLPKVVKSFMDDPFQPFQWGNQKHLTVNFIDAESWNLQSCTWTL